MRLLTRGSGSLTQQTVHVLSVWWTISKMSVLNRFTIGLLLMPFMVAAAQNQRATVVGQWESIDGRPAVVWDFDEHGTVTETLTAPGGTGTYSLDGNRLSLLFSDKSAGGAEVSVTRDTMTWTSVSGVLAIPGARPRDWRSTRIGPVNQQSAQIIGTWKMTSRPDVPSFQFWQFLPDGGFRFQEGSSGTYTLVNNIVTINIVAWYTASRTLHIPPQSYRVAGQGLDTTLTPINDGFRTLLPTLRRAPAQR